MFQVAKSISHIEKEALRNVGPPNGLGSWNYYRGLEESQSLSSRNGWNPVYIYDDQNPHARFVPMFSKTNSNDDFCYDQNMAKQYEETFRTPYYPKLQICIPFVPLEGSKFYTTDSKKDLIAEIQSWARQNDFKSIHVTLPDVQEYDLLLESNFFSSTQSLCYWHNQNYKTFADFLDKLKSKYRSQIIQERNVIQEKKYSHVFVSGDQIQPHHIDQFYDLFQITHDRKGWIMSYLTHDFFHSFAKTNSANMVFIFISHNEKVMAASCSFLQDTLLCGRFWGSTTDDDFLHFEAMCYLPIEYCIQNKIERMEIGFEKQHKLLRGFVPKEVKSFHWFANSTVAEKVKSAVSLNFPSTKNIFR